MTISETKGNVIVWSDDPRAIIQFAQAAAEVFSKEGWPEDSPPDKILEIKTEDEGGNIVIYSVRQINPRMQ